MPPPLPSGLGFWQNDAVRELRSGGEAWGSIDNPPLRPGPLRELTMAWHSEKDALRLALSLN